jgi:hypothetical protein
MPATTGRSAQECQQDRRRGGPAGVGGVDDADRGRPDDALVGRRHERHRERQDGVRRGGAGERETMKIGPEDTTSDTTLAAVSARARPGGSAPAVGIGQRAADEQHRGAGERHEQDQRVELRLLPDRGLDGRDGRATSPGG